MDRGDQQDLETSKIPGGGSGDNSSIPAREIPWTEETMQSMELQKKSDMTECTLTNLRIQETLTLKGTGIRYWIS